MFCLFVTCRCVSYRSCVGACLRQVRTQGPVDPLTQQPVKGRKRQGGVRFGEMERDGLLSHGTSFLLQDRLFINSDRSVVSRH